MNLQASMIYPANMEIQGRSCPWKAAAAWGRGNKDTMSSTVTASIPNSPPKPTTPSPIIDPFGRSVSYLRVSVTDRCDFRCVYCMAEDMSFLPKAEVLTLEELDRICSAFVGLGVTKLRLTGGEPLVRKGIMNLIRSLGRHLDSGALRELTLTTNGSQLERYATELYAAGVRRINVSIDTLDPHKFQAITRWGKLDKVFAGLRDQDQLRGAEGRQRRRVRPAGGMVRRRGFRPDLHRGHADGGYRRRDPAGPVPAAIAGALQNR
jgi:sulfatase maturation enzyme AslB (radical SAM superfamily)